MNSSKKVSIRLKKIGKEYFWEKSVYVLESKKIVRHAQWLEVIMYFIRRQVEA